MKSNSHIQHVKGANTVHLKLTKVLHCKNTMQLLSMSYNAPELLEGILQLVQRIKYVPELAPEPLGQAVRLLSAMQALVWDRIRVAVSTVQDPN